MSVLSFSVLCGNCEAALHPRDSWRSPDCVFTTRMSWFCETCDTEICVQMTEEGHDGELTELIAIVGSDE